MKTSSIHKLHWPKRTKQSSLSGAAPSLAHVLVPEDGLWSRDRLLCLASVSGDSSEGTADKEEAFRITVGLCWVAQMFELDGGAFNLRDRLNAARLLAAAILQLPPSSIDVELRLSDRRKMGAVRRFASQWLFDLVNGKVKVSM